MKGYPQNETELDHPILNCSILILCKFSNTTGSIYSNRNLVSILRPSSWNLCSSDLRTCYWNNYRCNHHKYSLIVSDLLSCTRILKNESARCWSRFCYLHLIFSYFCLYSTEFLDNKHHLSDVTKTVIWNITMCEVLFQIQLLLSQSRFNWQTKNQQKKEKQWLTIT